MTRCFMHDACLGRRVVHSFQRIESLWKSGIFHYIISLFCTHCVPRLWFDKRRSARWNWILYQAKLGRSLGNEINIQRVSVICINKIFSPNISARIIVHLLMFICILEHWCLVSSSESDITIFIVRTWIAVCFVFIQQF